MGRVTERKKWAGFALVFGHLQSLWGCKALRACLSSPAGQSELCSPHKMHESHSSPDCKTGLNENRFGCFLDCGQTSSLGCHSSLWASVGGLVVLLLPRWSIGLPPIPWHNSLVLFLRWVAGEVSGSSAVTSGKAVTTGVGMKACSWHSSLQSAVLSAMLLVGAWRRREPFSAVCCSCGARDALRSAFRSGQALQALANPLQESSCGLFRLRGLSWLIRAGGPVWRRWHMCCSGWRSAAAQGRDKAAGTVTKLPSPARPLPAALKASPPNPLQFWAISHAAFSAFCLSLV